MPTNTSTHPQPKPSEAAGTHKRLRRCITIFLATLVVIVGVTVLVIWLVIKPQRLIYTIKDGSIQKFNLNNNHLNSTINLIIRAHNPNRQATINYKWIKVSAAYDDQNIGFNMLEPFHQPTRNETLIKTRLVVQNEVLSESLSQALNRTKQSGKVILDVHVNAKIQFEVGMWKSRDRNLTVSCFPVLNFNLSKNFREKGCYIDL